MNVSRTNNCIKGKASLDCRATKKQISVGQVSHGELGYIHKIPIDLLWEFPSQNKNTCRAAQKEFVILETIRGLVPKCVPQLSVGSLTETLIKDVFERRKSTGSGSFSFMGSGLAQIFGQTISMRVKTLCQTNLLASSHIIKEDASLPVDVRRSKTPSLLTNNRPLPSSKKPYFQNEAKCTTFLVKMSFICMRMKNLLHIKG